MNNFDNNSTYKAKDCIALIVPNYSEPRDRLLSYKLKSCKNRIAYTFAKNQTKRCSWGVAGFFTKDPVFE